jgi:hypothetical protein
MSATHVPAAVRTEADPDPVADPAVRSRAVTYVCTAAVLLALQVVWLRVRSRRAARSAGLTAEARPTGGTGDPAADPQPAGRSS